MNIQNILMEDHSNYLWIFINVIEKIFTASEKIIEYTPPVIKGFKNERYISNHPRNLKKPFFTLILLFQQLKHWNDI